MWKIHFEIIITNNVSFIENIFQFYIVGYNNFKIYVRFDIFLVDSVYMNDHKLETHECFFLKRKALMKTQYKIQYNNIQKTNFNKFVYIEF